MNALPQHLEPWRSQLSLFPDDIAVVLGSLVAKVSGAFGTSHFQSEEGEPDGFSGVTLSGPLGRLLMSEWAMLDVHPDEFLRRLTNKEQSFYKLARTPLSGAKECMVLFDAGATQLGAPRIAQLALLVVLDERAKRSKINLRWGTLQDSSFSVYDSINPLSTYALLNAAKLLDDQDQLSAWLMRPECAEASECWLLGNPSLKDRMLSANHSALTIEEAILPGKSELKLTSYPSKSARPKEIRLSMPDAPTCVRILRDPFANSPAQRTTHDYRIRPESPIVFSTSDQKMHILTETGLLTINVPTSPRSNIGKPSHFVAPTGQRIVAVGRHPTRKRTVVVTEVPDIAYFVNVLSKRGTSANSTTTFDWLNSANMPSTQHLAECCVISDTYDFVRGNYDFVTLHEGGAEHSPHVRMLSSRIFYGEIFTADQNQLSGKLTVHSESKNHPLPSALPTPSLKHGRKPQFVFGVRPQNFAYQRAEGEWVGVWGNTIKFFDVDPIDQVAGVTSDQCLIVLLKNRQEFFRYESSGQATELFSVSERVFSAAMSTQRGVIVYITESGILGVYSLVHKCIVHRMNQEYRNER